MPTMPRLRSPLLLLAAATLAAAQDYQIVIDRPEKVAERAALHATCASNQQRYLGIGGTPMRRQDANFEITIDAERTVLEVSAQGQPTVVQLTIVKATRTEAGRGTAVLLPPGSVVLMAAGDKETTFSDGDKAALPVSALPSLRMTLHLSAGKAKDDPAFGSSVRRPLAASWPIEPQAAALVLQDLAFTVDPQHLSGTTTLAVALKGSGRDCLRLTTELAFSGFTMTLSKGMQVTASSATLEIARIVPVEVAAPGGQETRSLKLHMEAAGQATQSGVVQQIAASIDLTQVNELDLIPIASPTR